MPPPEESGASLPAALPVTAVLLPLLGSRTAPETAFQYVLQSVDAVGATIACPAWLVRRESFRAGDRVDLHFPFRTADGWHRHHAEITAARPDQEGTGQVCRAEFREREPLHHPLFASVETGEIVFRSAEGGTIDRGELLVSVLHDSLMRKRGIGVYFKHLVPLFSRMSTFSPADYGTLRTMLLDDIRRRIDGNIEAFARWHAEAAAGRLSPTRDLDLEQLRAATEPEIEGDLFDATFANEDIRQYLDAIRLLEHKLCLNYNTLVLLYTQGL
jgi:hypothetical protein